MVFPEVIFSFLVELSSERIDFRGGLELVLVTCLKVEGVRDVGVAQFEMIAFQYLFEANVWLGRLETPLLVKSCSCCGLVHEHIVRPAQLEIRCKTFGVGLHLILLFNSLRPIEHFISRVEEGRT